MTRLAGRSLSRLLKRWTPLIAKCVLTLTGHLRDQKTPEHVVLGSCTILSTQTVLRHLTTVTHYFIFFLISFWILYLVIFLFCLLGHSFLHLIYNGPSVQVTIAHFLSSSSLLSIFINSLLNWMLIFVHFLVQLSPWIFESSESYHRGIF